MNLVEKLTHSELLEKSLLALSIPAIVEFVANQTDESGIKKALSSQGWPEAVQESAACLYVLDYEFHRDGSTTKRLAQRLNNTDSVALAKVIRDIESYRNLISDLPAGFMIVPEVVLGALSECRSKGKVEYLLLTGSFSISFYSRIVSSETERSVRVSIVAKYKDSNISSAEISQPAEYYEDVYDLLFSFSCKLSREIIGVYYPIGARYMEHTVVDFISNPIFKIPKLLQVLGSRKRAYLRAYENFNFKAMVALFREATQVYKEANPNSNFELAKVQNSNMLSACEEEHAILHPREISDVLPYLFRKKFCEISIVSSDKSISAPLVVLHMGDRNDHVMVKNHLSNHGFNNSFLITCMNHKDADFPLGIVDWIITSPIIGPALEDWREGISYNLNRIGKVMSFYDRESAISYMDYWEKEIKPKQINE